MESKRPPLLLILETHPIQYRAPVYARLEQLCPGSIHVAYASDFSLRGVQDPGFATPVSWDTDLLAGYPSTVLNPHLTHAPCRWNDLDGRGLEGLFRELRPSAILLNSLNFRFDLVAYALARWRRIPIWMRCETQDQAFERSSLKSLLRSIYYRLLYSGISQAFPIGAYNRQHWLRHGLRLHQLRPAHYCTPDRAGVLSIAQRQDRRDSLRHQLGIHHHQLLVAFFGKLIPKKDPALLLNSLSFLPDFVRERIALVYVGSGEMQPELQLQAADLYARHGTIVLFPGFVNQSTLVDWYLAADVVVLPSRRAGETWGLVVNEALQAGCGVVVSEAVGCSADFGGWQRVRTIPVGSAPHLASAIEELAAFSRDYGWAAKGLQEYSIEAAALAFATAIHNLP